MKIREITINLTIVYCIELYDIPEDTDGTRNTVNILPLLSVFSMTVCESKIKRINRSTYINVLCNG